METSNVQNFVDLSSVLPTLIQRKMHSVQTNTGIAAVSQIPTKRKRGRPRKIPNIAMDMVAESALNEIRGALGMDQLGAENNQTLVEQQPVKRGRGRPRKNPPAPLSVPVPTPASPGENTAPVKRGRGRPRKLSIIEKEPPVVAREVDTSAVSELMFVEPAKVLHALPECEETKSQVNIAYVAGPSTTLNLLQDKALTSPPPRKSPSKPGAQSRSRQKKALLEDDAPLPSVGGMVETEPTVPVKRKRGRPPKQPSSGAPSAVKRPRGAPRKEPQEAVEPTVKRRPGRPRKNPVVSNKTEEPKIKRKPGRPRKNPLPPETQHEPVIKRKRGRPRKDASSSLPIPAQSSEPVSKDTVSAPFPTIALSPHSSYHEPSIPLNLSSETATSGGIANDSFQLALSSSDYDSGDSAARIEDNVANAIVTLSGTEIPKQDSPLLDESFVESSDEDD